MIPECWSRTCFDVVSWMATLDGYMMITKIKMPVMITKIKTPVTITKIRVVALDMDTKMIKVASGIDMKMIKVVPTMIRAGCETLMSKICFSRRRVTPEPPVERRLNWSKWRKTRSLHCLTDATTGIPV